MNCHHELTQVQVLFEGIALPVSRSHSCCKIHGLLYINLLSMKLYGPCLKTLTPYVFQAGVDRQLVNHKVSLVL